MLKVSHFKPWLWMSIWSLLIITALYFRPLLPVDETRYVSVAWEMWLQENFLVPYLNGTAYSHKPPFLFWMINIGWGVFGINEWWPRLVAPLFGLACLFLSSITCKRLAPVSEAYLIVPIILIGTIYWGIFTTLTMFDLIITFWTLIGINGLIDIVKGQKFRGWILYTIAISLGTLTKGPVILIYLLPIALLGPYWASDQIELDWRAWYLKILTSFFTAIAIALTWAIPAGIAGGEIYQNAIFWGQSAGRVVESFAHREPFWWYLAITPILLMPWLLWPSLLRKLWNKINNRKKIKKREPGLRILFVWITSTIIILSLISGKQPHYLLPIFPALGIAVAILITSFSEKDLCEHRLDMLPYTVLLLLTGLFIFLLPEYRGSSDIAEWTDKINRWWAIPLIGYGIFLGVKTSGLLHIRVIAISLIAPILIVSLSGILKPILSKNYDLRSISEYLAKQQRDGYIIANYGKYHGQFHFLGKLKNKIFEIGDGNIKNWLSENPRTKIISIQTQINNKYPQPEYVQRYRGKYILIWDRSIVINHLSAPQRK